MATFSFVFQVDSMHFFACAVLNVELTNMRDRLTITLAVKRGRGRGVEATITYRSPGEKKHGRFAKQCGRRSAKKINKEHCLPFKVKYSDLRCGRRSSLPGTKNIPKSRNRGSKRKTEKIPTRTQFASFLSER